MGISSFVLSACLRDKWYHLSRGARPDIPELFRLNLFRAWIDVMVFHGLDRVAHLDRSLALVAGHGPCIRRGLLWHQSALVQAVLSSIRESLA